MTGCIRWLPLRRVLTAAAVVAGVWLAWRLIAPGVSPVASMGAVLGWGLGLIPVHVTLTTPGEVASGRRVRRPAEEYGHRAARRTGGWGRRVQRPPNEAEPD